MKQNLYNNNTVSCFPNCSMYMYEESYSFSEHTGHSFLVQKGFSKYGFFSYHQHHFTIEQQLL